MSPGRSRLRPGLVVLLLLPISVSQGQEFAQLRRMRPESTLSARCVVLADIDGDGDTDSVVGGLSGSPEGLRLYLNEGSGVFVDVTAAWIPEASMSCQALAAGDLDGDGDLDLLFGDRLHHQDRLYLNDGAVRFVEGTLDHLAPGADSCQDVLLEDLDGDGWLDVLGCDYERASLYWNDGGGHLDAPTVLAGGAPTSLSVGDVDRDGRLDVLIGNDFGLQNLLFLNQGSRVFANATSGRVPVVEDGTRTVLLADVDGDGAPDAWIGNDYGEPTRLYLNDGAGFLVDVSATHLPADLGSNRAIAPGDLDGDGDPDVAVVHPDRFRLLRNDGAGHHQDVSPSDLGLAGTWDVAFGDVDIDGDLDAWTGEGLFLGDGKGTFRDVTSCSVPAKVGSSGWVNLLDVDGDRDIDAFVARPLAELLLYLNDGAGQFSQAPPSRLPSTAGRTSALAAADVDGDGDLDLLVGDDLERRGPRLYLNEGAGQYTDRSLSHLPADERAADVVGLADVDRDGDVDAYLAGGQHRLYLNDGHGTFSDVTATHMPNTSLDMSRSLALADLDRDGHVDALIGSVRLAPISRNRLLLNDGTGRFLEAPAGYLPNLSGFESLAPGDVDGDGDIDVLVGASPSAGFLEGGRLLLNDGVGHFTDAGPIHEAAMGARIVALGDVDRDGDLDALDGGTLLLNDGAGNFSPMPRIPDSRAATALALADLDGDRDLDVWMGGARDRILFNLTRQLSWRGLPRVGQPLVLDLYGAPGEEWLLLVSKGKASRIEAGGRLDADGRASLVVRIPADPGLVDVTLDWWARIGQRIRSPGAFRHPPWSHERTTFTIF